MSTYINTVITSGYGLTVASQNPVTIGPGGYITNTNPGQFFGDAIYGNTAAAWDITNEGVVNAQYGTSAGVDLRGGGSVTNTTGAQIAGVLQGIFITGTAAVINNAAGALVAGGVNGIYLLAASATVSNAGAIEATATNGHGIYLAASEVGVGVDNAQGGLISGGFDGVRMLADASSVTNDGTIQATAAGGAGIALLGTGGYVANFGIISGLVAGVDLFGTASVVTNFGTIVATEVGTLATGAYLQSGGTVLNGSTALVSGYYDGVLVNGNTANLGVVANLGTISGTGARADGARLVAYGYIRNYGVIRGVLNGVEIDTGLGTLYNYGTIAGSGTHSTGAYFAAGGIAVNNVNALLSGSYDGALVQGSSAMDYGTVTNLGTIEGSGAIADGVRLAAYGYVINQFGGLIGGVLDGVEIDSRFGILNNYGTIAGTGTSSTGAYFAAGGALINNANALLTGSYDGALVQGSAGNYGVVTNLGTIQGNGAIADGVRLAAYGYVINKVGGLIEGVLNGVEINSPFGILNNYGTIAGAGSHSAGAYFAAGGAVTNNAGALLTGNYDGAFVQGSAGDYGIITNRGTIEGTITGADGVRLAAYGYVVNEASGLIRGALDGVEVDSRFGLLDNEGTIAGSVAVYMKAGTVINGAPTATSALISGTNFGVYMADTTASTVSNFGTIQGAGIHSVGIVLLTTAAANVSNASSGLIAGTYDGIAIGAGTATVSNFGAIHGSGGAGIFLYASIGESIVVNGATNATSALISGYQNGILIASPSGTVINYGNVVASAATGTGIYLTFGTVTNFGTVTAGTNGTGIYLYGGNVTNSGTIIAPAATAVIVRYGTFFNSGLVEGAVSGIELSLGTGTAGSGKVSVSGTVIGGTGIGVAPGGTAAQTVTVTGSVIGTSGTAVSLTTGGSDRLIVAPGAAFTGVVDGGGGASVLEIAATAGAAAGLAGRVAAAGAAAYVSLGSVVNFSALEVDPGATFGGSGVLSFASLVNAGQIDIGAGNSLALGVVASAAATGAIDLETGGTVAFHGAVAAQRLIFQPPGGTALIDRPEAFAATLSGFTGTLDLLDLTALNPAGATATLNASDQLVVADGTQSVALQLDTGTDYTGVTWQTSADGTGGTDVAPVCFCRGTRVLTERGEVAVEALRVGDRVATLAGSFKPITWIGFGRDLVTRRNSLARPIVVRKGALADGVPRRDLYLTHGHALYLDGVLIPVEHLVNHRSILWDEAARIVEYYHIELAGHDVVLAEGAPAESYYDAGNRALFHNTRPGSNSAAVSGPCAPVVTGGAVVERVWARLFTRAGGCSDTDTTDDPDLHLVVAGERLDPVSRENGLYTFALAAPPAGPLFLRSRSAVPSLTGQSRRDHRRLGVAIRQIVLQQPGIMTCLDHNAPAFRTGGCHLPEAGHSWTDGELALPAALFAHLGGPFALLLHTSRQALRYPIPAPPAAAHAA